MRSLAPILLVDDSARDRELVIDALEAHGLANEIIALRDGAEALEYLFRRGAFAQRPPGNPVVMLLDLKMPRVDGTEVLRQVRAEAQLRLMPVVVMTSSREEQDLVASYQLGVNSYVVKPVNFHEFVDAVKSVGGYWAVLNEPPPAAALPPPVR